MAEWHHQCNGHELGQILGDGEGHGGPACCSAWDHRVRYDSATKQQQHYYSISTHIHTHHIFLIQSSVDEHVGCFHVFAIVNSIAKNIEELQNLRRNGVALIVNKRFQNAVLGCNLKNDRMISICFQGKPFNITVIQVYAPTTNAKEAEVERFYNDLRDLLELTPKKDVLFIIGDWNKSRKSRDIWSNKQIWPWSTK